MPDLIIVESPNKIKKIKSYIDKTINVNASCGHIRNMDPKCMSIDIDETQNKFEPHYLVVADKKKIVSQLKSDVKYCGSSGTIYLAMDYDREGEAIAWHLNEVLKLKPQQTKRILFTEITKKAILASLANPTQIDMNMFYSQQARMVLDKLIGYMISPILWKQYNNWKLSAGRVQSVVVKIIQEREDEIAKFKSSNFFKVNADFWIDKSSINKFSKAILKTTLEDDIKTKKELDNLVSLIPKKDTTFKVISNKTAQSKRKPPPPFITSSLQQEASIKLNMSPKSTMSAAQKLYENGLITYMRTDSTVLCDDAHKAIYKAVVSKFGENYYKKIQYKSKSKSSQEAHEAIRPTHFEKEDILAENSRLTSYENKLYKLIWKRTIASQMKPANVETTTVKVSPVIKDNIHIFTGKFEKILFDGYLVLYKVRKENTKITKEDEDEEGKSKKTSNNILNKVKALKKGDEVFYATFEALEKNSKPSKSRFTEASLIKKLDELEIGRPSTFASMTTKVQTKLYVEKKTIPPIKKDFIQIKLKYPNEKTETTKKIGVDGEKNKLFVTPLGFMVNDYLNKQFASILDYGFTANVETLLDEIAKGNKVWNIVVGEVYKTFNPTVERLNLELKTIKQSGGGASKYETIELGLHPYKQIPIIVINTKYGPAVVLNYEDKKDRIYANFTGKLEDMTIDKALKLLEYPKILGQLKKHDIIINRRQNYYLTYNKKHYSIDTYNKSNENTEGFVSISGECIILEEAITIIESILNQSNNNIEITKDIVITKGPYGFYIKYKGKENVSIPYKLKKKYDTLEKIKEMTLLECEECIEKYKEKKEKGGSGNKKPYKKKK